MKIAILGTRGIPNYYGGFEQLAQCLSLGLTKKGHQVFVYNSHTHPYQEKTWKGVNIIHCYDPEHKIGTAGQFIYDFNCIINTRKQDFDLILNLGYTSSSVWMRLFPKKTFLVTNMDGLEWKRTKYSPKVQRFLMYAEKLAAKHSQLMIADSRHIQNYLFEKYGQRPHYIAYGAELFDAPDASVLNSFKVEPFGYNMIIARMEPENNIETILDGIHRSSSQLPFFVVSNAANTFGLYLQQKYKDDRRIIFTGAIYDSVILNNLRHHAHVYFHGHSVGGTNPSLLEAMGCRCFIVAHDNEFNRGVLGNDGLYFTAAEEIAGLLAGCDRSSERSLQMTNNNYEKIKKEYSWEKIINDYEAVMIAGTEAKIN